MSWDSSNIVCFTERPDPSGLSYFVITSGGYFCNVFLREDMNLLFQPQSPKEWTSRTPLTREQIARETTRLNGHCEAKGLRLERVPDRHGVTSLSRVSTVEILETDVGGGRANMAVRNGYFIKEDLKPLGFRWGGTHAGNPNREWRIPNGLYSEERREIARKIEMACVQVKFMDLRCKYVPLTKSSDVAPVVISAVAAPTEARPTDASGVPEVHQRELVSATVLRAPSHGGDSLTGGIHGGGVSTLKTETSQPLHLIKDEQPSTTTDEPFPVGSDGNGKDNIDPTSNNINSTDGNNTKGLEKVAQVPTVITPPVKSRRTPTTLPEYFAAARNKNRASITTSTTSTISTGTGTNTGPTTPSKTKMSPFFVEKGDRRLFVFGQKFNTGSKKTSPRKQNPRHNNMLPFRLEMGSSVATTESSAPSTIKHQPGNFSIPSTRKYSSSSSSTTSANSASSPASAVMYPPSPVGGNKKAQDLFNVPMFAYRNDDRKPQKESPDTPLFAHRNGGKRRDVSGRRDDVDAVDGVDGGGGRRLENEFEDIPLVCREPPSWVSLAFSSETCQPRFSPMMSSMSSGGEGHEDEERDAGEDCQERSPRWPSMLHSVEVSVGGRGLQARRAVECLLSSSSRARGPLDGVLVWRKETEVSCNCT